MQTRRATQIRLHRAATAIVVVLVCTLAACSSQASTRSGGSSGPTTEAAPVAINAKVPAGVTLRVGDQLEYLETVLKLAGEDEGFPYKVDYSAFVGGPPMLQAFQADALDVGFVGSTPLIFAQAGGQDLTAVATWSSKSGSYGLVTAPGQSDIKGWKDLKGKKVAFQQGTAGEAALLQALDSVGLTLADVTPVNIVQTQVTSALQSGSADAGLSIEPLTSGYLASNPTAKQVARASEITDRSSFLIATNGTLEDKAKTAALGDYLARLVRAFNYLRAHPDQVVASVYVKQYGLTPERAKQVQAEVGPVSFSELPDGIEPQQQKLADLFVEAGEIPSKIDVSSEFDPRFNDLVVKAQGPS